MGDVDRHVADWRAWEVEARAHGFYDQADYMRQIADWLETGKHVESLDCYPAAIPSHNHLIMFTDGGEGLTFDDWGEILP